MPIQVGLYAVLCAGIGLMALETVDFHRWRWSTAGLFRFTFWIGVLLAIGRFLAFVGRG